MNGPVAKYSFMAWSRQGVAALIDAPDPLDDTLDANISLPVHLEVNNGGPAGSADLDLRLYGPGDVVGIDPRQVIRSEPRDQTKDYIPNYLPAIEFDRPDLPWLFTPASATGRDRLRPWMYLVVVERKPGVSLDFTREMELPTLSIGGESVPADELPPLEDSWAWAHVQVSGDLAATTLEQLAVEAPHRLSSRLVCPRRLLPNRDYIACVVPAFDIGLKSALGLPVDSAALAPAWRSDAMPAAIRLPVYYHWEFSTGERGDFEALARLLEPRVAPETLGRRPMDITRPGFGMPDAPTDAERPILGLEGALQATTAARTDWPGDERDDFQSSLRAILDAPHTAGPQHEPGPLIAPPLYGRWHAAQPTIPVDEPRWFRQLNLDPRERTVAGFGTIVVADEQESLMHSAWEQVEDIVKANGLLVRAQLARSVGLAILDNDLAPLGVDSLVQMTSPLHARVRMSPVTLRKTIHDSVVPDAVATGTFRRISRPRGPFARRLSPRGQDRMAPIVTDLNTGLLAAAVDRSRPDGALTPAAAATALVPGWLPARLRPLLKHAYRVFAGLLGAALTVLVLGRSAGRLTGRIRNVIAAAVAVGAAVGAVWARRNTAVWQTADRLAASHVSNEDILAATPRPEFVLVDEGSAPADPAPDVFDRRGPDSEMATLFRQAAAEFQASIDQATELAQPAAVPRLALGQFRSTLFARIDPAVSVKAFIDERIAVDPAIWDPATTVGDGLEPIMVYPRFERPMYEALRDVSQDLLLPGLEAIEPNTITLLETNPPFVEAYMAGLNHEMARELLWRGFPTDQRGSYFRQFWDVRGRVPAPLTLEERDQAKDIPEIHGWRGDVDLGANMTGGGLEGSLVVLVRGELLRRFPTAMVYASQAKFVVNDDGEPTRERALTEVEKHPLFRGTLHPDVTFIGFDLDDDEARGDPDPTQGKPGWFFVFQEQPTEPRFGLDVLDGFAGDLTLEKWSDLSWGHLAQNQADFDQLTHIRLDDLLPDTSNVSDPPGVIWGENAAHMAFVTLQQPVRIGIHADDMLPT